MIALAEAGSGESEELQEQARALTAKRQFAFYTTVRNIARDGLVESLTRPERERVSGWLASADPAWFFIDSVDEAKLERIELSSVLRKIADAIGRRHDESG